MRPAAMSLLPTAYNFCFSSILLSKLRPKVDEIIGDYLCGFLRNLPTAVQTFIFLHLSDTRQGVAVQADSTWAIIDFRKAMIQLGGKYTTLPLNSVYQ